MSQDLATQKRKFLPIMLLVAVGTLIYFIQSQDKVFMTGGVNKKVESTFLPTRSEVLDSKFTPVNSSKLDVQSIRSLLEDKINSPLIIHFWATWCVPCLEEIPSLVMYGMKNQQRELVRFIFVAVNDTDQNVEKFLKSKGIDYKNFGVWLLDNKNQAYEKFRVDKVPETFIIRENILRLSGAQMWR